MKRCGLYIRVSTERQAKVEEGSLKNQDQLLTQHIELKSKISQENWIIVERGILMKVNPPRTPRAGLHI